MSVTIEYHTLAFWHPIKGEGALALLGEQGWRLGGVAQETTREPIGMGHTIPKTTYYFYFWREVPGPVGTGESPERPT
jgi:hypothetical protein